MGGGVPGCLMQTLYRPKSNWQEISELQMEVNQHVMPYMQGGIMQ